MGRQYVSINCQYSGSERESSSSVVTPVDSAAAADRQFSSLLQQSSLHPVQAFLRPEAFALGPAPSAHPPRQVTVAGGITGQANVSKVMVSTKRRNYITSSLKLLLLLTVITIQLANIIFKPD